MTEYILVIALVVLGIAVALMLFRLSAAGFTGEVTRWVSDHGILVGAATSPPAAGDPAAMSPSPSASPEDLASWLAGEWCFQDSEGRMLRWSVRQTGPELVHASVPGLGSGADFTIRPSGPDRFVLTSPANGSTATYLRLPDGRIAYEWDGRPGNAFGRCP